MLTVLLRLLAELLNLRPKGMNPGDGGPAVHRAVAEFERHNRNDYQSPHESAQSTETNTPQTKRPPAARMNPIQSLIAKRLPPTYMNHGDHP